MSKILNLDQVQFDGEGANSYKVERNFAPGPTGDQIDAAVVTAQYTEIEGSVTDQAIKLPADMRPGATFIIRNQGLYRVRLYPPAGFEFNNFGLNNFLRMEPYNPGTFWEGEVITCRYLGGTQIMATHEVLIQNAGGAQEILLGRSTATRIISDFSIGGRYISFGFTHLAYDNVNAYAGGGQTNATVLGACGSTVNPSGTPANNDSVKFWDQVFLAGTPMFVWNNTGFILDVYPQNGGFINGGAQNAPFSMAPDQRTLFLSIDVGGVTWKTFGSDTA